MNLSTKSTTTFLAFLAATSGVNAGCADPDGPGTSLGLEAAEEIVLASDWFEQHCTPPTRRSDRTNPEAECEKFAINYCIGNMNKAVEAFNCHGEKPPVELMNTWSEECSDKVSSLLSTSTPAPTPAPYTPDFPSDVTYYFDSELAADPYADVPASKGSMSTGKGTLTVKSDGTVTLDIAWYLRGNDGGIPSYNALKGIHIHKGDEDTNGPIVFGFCGDEHPLPKFGGTCQQGWSSESAQVATQYDGKICDITGNDSPCYMNGHWTAAEAAQALIDGEDMYLNVHTTKSLQANGNAGPLGLIRGQLKLKEESSTPTTGTDKVVVVATKRDI